MINYYNCERHPLLDERLYERQLDEDESDDDPDAAADEADSFNDN